MNHDMIVSIYVYMCCLNGFIEIDAYWATIVVWLTGCDGDDYCDDVMISGVSPECLHGLVNVYLWMYVFVCVCVLPYRELAKCTDSQKRK